MLARMYEHGRVVPQNYREALKWYTSAAEQHPEAAYRLAKKYDEGQGNFLPQDYREAIKWYTLSAEQGNAHAQNALGLMHETGHSVSENQIIAYVWFNLASIYDHSEARENRDSVVEKLSDKELIKAQELSQEFYERIQAADN